MKLAKKISFTTCYVAATFVFIPINIGGAFVVAGNQLYKLKDLEKLMTDAGVDL